MHPSPQQERINPNWSVNALWIDIVRNIKKKKKKSIAHNCSVYIWIWQSYNLLKAVGIFFTQEVGMYNSVSKTLKISFICTEYL